MDGHPTKGARHAKEEVTRTFEGRAFEMDVVADEEDEIVDEDAPIWPLVESKSFFNVWLFNVFDNVLFVVSWLEELLLFFTVEFVQFVILLSWFSWLFKFEFTIEVEPF